MATTSNLGITKINGSDYVDVEAFNDAFDKIDVLGKDYVIEVGTSGIWKYQKWKSGKVECWGISNAPATNYTRQFGSAYYKEDMGTFPVAFPFTFKNIPVVNITLNRFQGNQTVDTAGTTFIWTWNIANITTQRFTYLPAAMLPIKNCTVSIGIHVVGDL